MASIPTIPGTDVSPSITPAESPSLAVQIDATPGLKARGAMADAVTTAATVIGDYEDKKQKLQEFDIANKSYLSFTKLKQEFDKQIDTTPHDQLENKWNQMSSDWRSQQEEQYKGKLTREAQMEIGNHWDTAITGVNGQVNVIATRKFHEEVLAGVDANYNHAAQSLDPDTIAAAKALGAEAVKNGSATKGYIEDRNYKLDVRVQESQVSAAMEGSIQDKMAMQEKLKNKEQLPLIPTLRRPAFIHQLKESIAGDQARNGESLTDRILNADPKDWPTREELNEDVSNGNITATREKNALNLMSTLTKRTSEDTVRANREIASLANLQIYNHDWKNDSNPKQTYQEISDQISGLPASLQKTILREAGSKRDAALRHEEVKEKPIERDLYARGKRNFALGLFRPPLQKEEVKDPAFYKLDYFSEKVIKNIPATADAQWIKHSSPEAQAAAALRYADWQDKMREYFDGKKAKNEPIDSREAEAYSQSILSPDLENQVANALMGKK